MDKTRKQVKYILFDTEYQPFLVVFWPSGSVVVTFLSHPSIDHLHASYLFL
jgi:hypothetical protein